MWSSTFLYKTRSRGKIDVPLMSCQGRGKAPVLYFHENMPLFFSVAAIPPLRVRPTFFVKRMIVFLPSKQEWADLLVSGSGGFPPPFLCHPP